MNTDDMTEKVTYHVQTQRTDWIGQPWITLYILDSPEELEADREHRKEHGYIDGFRVVERRSFYDGPMERVRYNVVLEEAPA